MTLDSFGLEPLAPDALVLQAPCADCSCGSLCHWDDLRTPNEGAAAADWALAADRDRIGCQRCPKCEGYRLR